MTTHRLDHRLSESHYRCHWFGIVAEDEAKINVEKLPLWSQHYILQMTVTHTQQIRDHAVAGYV